MLKLEMQNQDGKIYLQISCEGDDVESTGTDLTEENALDKLQIHPDVCEDTSLESETLRFVPRIYVYQGYVIVELIKGEFVIYENGKKIGNADSLSDAKDTINKRIAINPKLEPENEPMKPPHNSCSPQC